MGNRLAQLKNKLAQLKDQSAQLENWLAQSENRLAHSGAWQTGFLSVLEFEQVVSISMESLKDMPSGIDFQHKKSSENYHAG